MGNLTGNHPTPYSIVAGLAVYRFGTGEPVLLMPGPHRFQKPGDRSADALIGGLIELDRSVITYDPPGAGQSTRPAQLGMPEMHYCANEALDVCEVSGPVDALGHSMGGLALIAYAIELPARVKSLVLVGTGSGGRAYMKASGALWNRSHPAFWHTVVLGILTMVWPRLAPEKIMLNFIERQSFYDRGQAELAKVNVRDWLRHRRGRTDWHQVARKLDYAPHLGEIVVPTLLLCGRQDPQYPPACSEELAAGIPKAHIKWFERSGHYPFIEEPEAFWQNVGDFLRVVC